MRTLEADFTRYSVVFTGEQLPDGRRADAVYIILNEPYREVLNNAPVRPLDRAYMKELPPAAQRFYEILSYKIFSAIKNHYPHAKISYSEYCTFSAQLRHYERQPVQDQMAKVIRPHKQSGYITAVRYQPTIDDENKPDWILYLTPGPKAHAEFAVAHGRKPRKAVEALTNRSRGAINVRRESIAAHRSEPITPRRIFDPQLVAEFTRRGITEEKAIALLANLKPGQDVVAQLEHAEQTVEGTASYSHARIGTPPDSISASSSATPPFPTALKRARSGKRARSKNERTGSADSPKTREQAARRRL